MIEYASLIILILSGLVFLTMAIYYHNTSEKKLRQAIINNIRSRGRVVNTEDKK